MVKKQTKINLIEKRGERMRILPLNQLKTGMRLGQNIYRHDGMLAIPKGSIIYQRELDTLKYFMVDFVFVADYGENFAKKEDLNFTLNILEASYKQSNLWSEKFGIDLFRKVSGLIIKNRKLKKYINELRNLDSYSFAHSINISMVVATLLSPDMHVDDELAELVMLSLMHDIGRIKMDNIFNKEGKLNDDEFKQLTEHPKLSLKMLRKAGYSEYDLKFVAETHERWDGGGYPERIRGEEISDLAQLIFIADMYNALSSYRPYRGIYSPYSVIQIVESEREKAFGGRYIDVFLDRFTPYPIGSMVELNNGFTGIVKKMRSHRKLLPVVDIISEKTGEKTAVVDLSVEPDLRIKKILKTY